MPETWFTSSNKLELKRTEEAERVQKALQEEEMNAVRSEHESRMASFNSSIENSTARIAQLKRQSDNETKAKQQEINDEKAKHNGKLSELEMSFEMSKSKLGNESKEKLKELQMQHKKEKDELNSAHKRVLEEKKQELNQIKDTHKTALTAVEQEHKQLYQDRKDEVTKSNAEMAALRTKHTGELKSELDKIKEINIEVLNKQKKAIKEETRNKTAKFKELLDVQIANQTGVLERDVADCVTSMTEQIYASAEAVLQLKQSCNDIEEEQDLSALLTAKNSNSEWRGSNQRTQKATHRLRQMLNNYSSINQEFRAAILELTNEIDGNLMAVQSLDLAITRAIDKGNYDALKDLSPEIGNQLQFLTGMDRKLRQVCAPHDATLGKLEGKPQKEVETSQTSEQKQIKSEDSSNEKSD